MNNKFKDIVCLIVLSLFSHGQAIASTTPGMCDIEGVGSHTPVVEYTKGNNSILFVGYTHYGTSEYMKSINSSIKDWSSQFKSVSILKELVYCDASSIGVKEGSNFSIEELQEIYSGLTSKVTMNLSERLKAKVTDIKCKLDIDNISHRPSYVVDRNIRLCNEQEDDVFACQWNQDYALRENIDLVAGDLKVNQLDDYTKLAISMAYSDWEVEGFKSRDDAYDNPKVVEVWGKIFKKVILDDRDEWLTNLALDNVKEGKAVVLPWGTGHVEGVEGKLIAHGYKKTILGYSRFNEDSDYDEEDPYPICPTIENTIEQVTSINDVDNSISQNQVVNSLKDVSPSDLSKHYQTKSKKNNSSANIE